MIEKIFIISFIVMAIAWCFEEGEIFEFVQKWFKNWPDKLKKPVFDCCVCMCPYWGTGIYWLIWGLWKHTATWQENIVVVLAATGFNAIMVKLWPEK